MASTVLLWIEQLLQKVLCIPYTGHFSAFPEPAALLYRGRSVFPSPETSWWVLRSELQNSTLDTFFSIILKIQPTISILLISHACPNNSVFLMSLIAVFSIRVDYSTRAFILQHIVARPTFLTWKLNYLHLCNFWIGWPLQATSKTLVIWSPFNSLNVSPAVLPPLTLWPCNPELQGVPPCTHCLVMPFPSWVASLFPLEPTQRLSVCKSLLLTLES